MDLKFFRAHQSDIAAPLEINYSFELWKPTIMRVFPQGISRFHQYIEFIKLWTMQYLVLQDKHFSALVIRDSDEIIHYTVLLSPCYRFPFMAHRDFQLGPAWTSEKYRCQGLALFAIRKIASLFSANDRYFWWICDSDNIGSQKTITKAGFFEVGEGTKTKILGSHLIGKFEIQSIKNNKQGA